MGKKRKQPTPPIELEVRPLQDVTLRRFLVTAYSNLPADHRTEEPDIRVEVEACSGSAASVEMMRQFRRPSYYYMTITDITPAKKRRSHIEEAEECESV